MPPDDEDGLDWAIQCADRIVEKQYANMGVTYSPGGEYTASVDVLPPQTFKINLGPIPVTDPVPPQLAALQAFDGKTWSSGPPPAFIRQWLGEIAAVWPTIAGLPAYCNSAANEPGYWSACGCGAAYAMTKAGIAPVFGAGDLNRFLWAEAWLDWGTPVPTAQAQPGDVAIFDFGGGDHHVTIVQKNPGDGTLACLGSNQGHAVKVSVFNASSVQGIRRPSAATIAPSNPHPEIKLGATGAAVIELQGLLGLSQTGTFDLATDAAVRAYQVSRGLDVDGEVGVNTWGALLSKAPVQPPVSVGSTLSADVVAKITTLATSSALAHVNWTGRGVAPIGYTKGMAVAFGKVYLDLKAGGSAALAMSAPPTTDATKDALLYYGVTGLTSRALTLRALFSLLIGLGMRESSGNCFEGRDQSADNFTADTAEAGLFQQSWNSRAASPELPKLLASWSVNPSDGFLSIFREGVGGSMSANEGSGEGVQFQALCKSKPCFAVECAAVGLRTIGGGPAPYGHWGPIRARAAEMRPEADALLSQVQAIVDAVPAKPTDPIIIIPPIKPEKPMPDNPTPYNAAVEDTLAELRPILVKRFAALQPQGSPQDAIDALIRQLGGTPHPRTPAPILLPGTVTPPAPVPNPPPSPATPATPIIQKPSVQASAVALAIGGVLQALGYVGTPFGLGADPTTAGTLTALIPLLTGIVGSTGTFGTVLSALSTIIGAFQKKPQPAPPTP